MLEVVRETSRHEWWLVHRISIVATRFVLIALHDIQTPDDEDDDAELEDDDDDGGMFH